MSELGFKASTIGDIRLITMCRLSGLVVRGGDTVSRKGLLYLDLVVLTCSEELAVSSIHY